MKLRMMTALFFIGLLSRTFAADLKCLDPYDLMDKQLRLPAPMALAQVKHFNPLDYNGYWLLSFPQKMYVNNYINHTVPTLEEYKDNPPHWQKWEGNVLIGWSRIVNVLDKGTQFHVIEAVRNNNSLGYWVTVEFDEGIYKGTTAMVANYQNLLG